MTNDDADTRAGDAQATGKGSDRAALKARWTLEIQRYEQKAARWMKWGNRILERYTQEKKEADQAAGAKFNVLWSNIQTLRPALYAKDPTPEVERRFKDEDPVGRVASDVLERCLAFLVGEERRFGQVMGQVVLDRLLPGRGVAWVRYVPHFRDMAPEAESPEENEDEAPEQEVSHEEVSFEFVPFMDAGHTIARNWAEVRAVWRVVSLDRDDLVERFGDELGRQIPLDEKPSDLGDDNPDGHMLAKARVYEIWDKKKRQVIWLHRSMPEVLDVRDDPLGLSGFFPCPRFLQATTASKSYIPTADYVQWQDQAAELDRLTARIQSLTKAMRVVGVYDTSAPALGRLLSTGSDNIMVPVDNWAMFAERGGLKGAVDFLPMADIANALIRLQESRERVKADLYEISGLSDLLRGVSDPDETASAQQIKANFASVRLKEMQRETQHFARDLVAIAGEIVAQHFGVDTIRRISGVKLLTNAEKSALQAQMMQAQMAQQAAQGQPGGPPAAPMPPVDPKAVRLLSEPSWEDVEALLRDSATRGFRIDIETDSTIAQDESAERQRRMEFAETVGRLIQGAAPIVQTMPALAPALAETVMFVLRSFRVGRSTESAFQKAMDQVAGMAQQPPAPQGDKGKGDMLQVEQVKQQGEMQRTQVETQADLQKVQLQAQLQAQSQQAQFAHQMQIEQQKMQQHAQIEQYKAQLEHQREAERAMREHEAKMTQMANKSAMRQDQVNERALQASANASDPM